MVSLWHEVSTCLSVKMCQDIFNFRQSPEQREGIFKSRPNGGGLPDKVRNVFKAETLHTHSTDKEKPNRWKLEFSETPCL